MNLAEFFHMGGYAFYVWTAYALAVIVLALNIVVPLRRKSALLERLARSVKQSNKRP